MKYAFPRVSLISVIFLFSLFLFSRCQTNESPGNTNKRDLDFTRNWRFSNDSATAAHLPGFDDSGWKLVDLPHDWSVEIPFDSSLEMGVDVGYLPGGNGWYRKVFSLKRPDKDKQVYLQFDGIQTTARIWINGKEAGEHVNGYTPFHLDVSDLLNPPEEENVIAIQVHQPQKHSRWFSGAGIYRDVRMSLLDPVHIALWGVSVTTSQLSDSEAILLVNVKLQNKDPDQGELKMITWLRTPTGEKIPVGPDQDIPGFEKDTFISFQVHVPEPQPWGPDHPALYTLEISLTRDQKEVDRHIQPFGIRTISFSASGGFLLNGKEVLLRGACLHHDNGILGAAAFSDAEDRKVRIMKENGYNAIRTSHNPPSAAFLDACDRLGMLVIDEAFDMWIRPKRPNDYHQYFNSWWKKDLKSMILRDRNHPCVIMWSFGNEVNERADPEGISIAAEMIGFIRSIDDTRPVTQAICDFWDHPGRDWIETDPAFEPLDVSGYNYQWERYESDHSRAPERVMYGSESVAREAYENWSLVEKLPYVIGDFIWTGMDYLGESGIGNRTYVYGAGEEDQFLMPWPWYISWCGDLDITGNKKPQSFFRDVVWGQSNLEILVHEPLPEGATERVSFWGWPAEENHWNWKGQEGIELEVHVYSTYPEIMLELNGQMIGKRSISEADRLTATFRVPYEPGLLKAIGMDPDGSTEEKFLITSGPAVDLKLLPERTEIEANRNRLVFIPVFAIDSSGNPVPDTDLDLKVTITGEGELLAAGNASPQVSGSFRDDTFRLFKGKALIIVRSTGRSGTLEVLVESPAKKILARSTVKVY